MVLGASIRAFMFSNAMEKTQTTLLLLRLQTAKYFFKDIIYLFEREQVVGRARVWKQRAEQGA